MTTLLIISHVTLCLAAFLIGKAVGYDKCLKDEERNQQEIDRILNKK